MQLRQDSLIFYCLERSRARHKQWDSTLVEDLVTTSNSTILPVTYGNRIWSILDMFTIYFLLYMMVIWSRRKSTIHKSLLSSWFHLALLFPRKRLFLKNKAACGSHVCKLRCRTYQRCFLSCLVSFWKDFREVENVKVYERRTSSDDNSTWPLV